MRDTSHVLKFSLTNNISFVDNLCTLMWLRYYSSILYVPKEYLCQVNKYTHTCATHISWICTMLLYLTQNILPMHTLKGGEEPSLKFLHVWLEIFLYTYFSLSLSLYSLSLSLSPAPLPVGMSYSVRYCIQQANTDCVKTKKLVRDCLYFYSFDM